MKRSNPEEHPRSQGFSQSVSGKAMGTGLREKGGNRHGSWGGGGGGRVF